VPAYFCYVVMAIRSFKSKSTGIFPIFRESYLAVSREQYTYCVVNTAVQGLDSVADRVAARVIARERRGRILSNFHIVESMPKSVSILIHYIHLVHDLVLSLVLFLAFW
jgi:hypothetical protein